MPKRHSGLIICFILYFALSLYVSGNPYKKPNPRTLKLLTSVYPNMKTHKGRVILEQMENVSIYLVEATSKKWRWHPEMKVLLVVYSTDRRARFFGYKDTEERGEIGGNFKIFLIKKDSNVTLIAQSDPMPIGFATKADNIKSHYVKLDLANYRISEHHTAIGVRTASTYQVRFNESLLLFIQRDNKLKLVFDHYSAFSDRFREYSALFIVKEKSRNGFFDIVRRTVSQSFAEGSKPELEKIETFFWNPSYERYESK